MIPTMELMANFKDAFHVQQSRTQTKIADIGS